MNIEFVDEGPQSVNPTVIKVIGSRRRRLERGQQDDRGPALRTSSSSWPTPISKPSISPRPT